MRLFPSCLLLLTALPALAQGTEGHWCLDIHRVTPTLVGHFQGDSDGNGFNVDLQDDLGLARSTTRIGYGLEYQGTRFGLEFSMDGQDYQGSNRVQRPIEMDGVTYDTDALVQSTIKTTTATFNGTFRALKFSQFWAGLDLGVRVTRMQISASGVNPFTSTEVSETGEKIALPVPQLGLSGGWTARDNSLVARAQFHLLAFKGCTYTHSSGDLRYFPIPWLGLRVFADAEHFRVPKGSILDDLDITLDRTGVGFGLVARY